MSLSRSIRAGHGRTPAHGRHDRSARRLIRETRNRVLEAMAARAVLNLTGD